MLIPMQNPLSLTNYWLEKIVIALELCPFIKIPWERGLIRVSVCPFSDEEAQGDYFLEELTLLQKSPSSKLSTTLIVYPEGDADFLAFNDFVGYLEDVVSELGLSDTFQLVVFHPGFMFFETSSDDAQNLVNRSPYPSVHILRSEDLDRARLLGKEAEDVSFRNEKKLKAMSEEDRRSLFYFLKDQSL